MSDNQKRKQVKKLSVCVSGRKTIKFVETPTDHEPFSELDEDISIHSQNTSSFGTIYNH